MAKTPEVCISPDELPILTEFFNPNICFVRLIHVNCRGIPEFEADRREV